MGDLFEGQCVVELQREVHVVMARRCLAGILQEGSFPTHDAVARRGGEHVVAVSIDGAEA